MDGYLLIDKPEGISSFGVVAKVRYLIKEATGQKVKIGHTGTLDPAATGLMILVIGSYTKRASVFSKLDKTYEAQLTLGSTSSTGDKEGEIVKVSDKRPPTSEITGILKSFIGQISQVPPAFSAVKVNGQRAYRLARAGKEVVIQPRKVQIYSIAAIKYDYPKLSFTVEVSSGTYIRSLVEDVGKSLGTRAFLNDLRRITIGDFRIEDSSKLDELNYSLILQKVKS